MSAEPGINLSGIFPDADFVRQIFKYVKYLLTSGVDSLINEPYAETETGLAFMAGQLRELLIMAACGACAALMFYVYDGYARRLTGSGKMRTVQFIADIIFCIFLGIVIAEFWFKSSYGRLSFHESLGFICGAAVGIRTFAVGKSKRRHTIAAIYVILIITAYFVIS